MNINEKEVEFMYNKLSSRIENLIIECEFFDRDEVVIRIKKADKEQKSDSIEELLSQAYYSTADYVLV
jgi:hypothetical protein